MAAPAVRRIVTKAVMCVLAGGALAAGAVSLAGPESWRLALREIWTSWLSPRHAAGEREEWVDPPAQSKAAVSAVANPDDESSPKSLPEGDLYLPLEEAPADGLLLTDVEEPPIQGWEPVEDAPGRRLPGTPLKSRLPEPPVRYVQLETDEAPPIVDRPPRKLPPMQAEPLPEVEPSPEPARLPAARGSVSPPVEPAPQPTIGRPGLRLPLAPIVGIEDKTSRARPLQERGLIDKAAELGDLPTALRELSRWYWRHPDLRESLHAELEELANQVYFSPRPHFHEPYVIQPGDRLQSVARKYNVPWEYLCRANKVDARKIRAGQKLKVVDGPFSAYVSLTNYELIVHHKGAFVRWYPVGAGKPGTTPTGTFTVREKLTDPTYYGDDGVIAHNDPKNPLGERWIDIGDSYGIHGTIEPDSIGKNESRGCIRLLNDDVAELYDLLSVGSQVTIEP